MEQHFRASVCEEVARSSKYVASLKLMENTQLPGELVAKRLIHGIEDKRLAEKYLKTTLSIGYKKFNWLL